MSAPRTGWRASIASSFLPPLIWALIFGTWNARFPLSWSVFAQVKSARQQASDAFIPVHADPDGYVGSAACTECHAGISASFARTRMGRSLNRYSPSEASRLPVSGSFESESTGRHFEVFSRDGKLFQSESAPGPGGIDIFRNTQEVKWIVGAGANGYSGLVQQGDYLFEAPLTFYTRTNRWEPSPGYQQQDNGFHRPILAGCIACHSGRPAPLEEDTGKFKADPFPQTSIGCENCHGPGAAHVRAMKTGKARGRDTLIVNPDRLSADLENDICMSCHEAGDARVPKPGKTYQDFRPGRPLDEAVSIFMVPLKRDDPDTRDHVQHYFEMSMSKCFRSTSGQLRCATCHDPHFEPTQDQAPDYFNRRCMNCHASHLCTASLEARQKTTPVDNCIGCHMPPRLTPQTPHTSLTNHRILVRPGEPWPDEAFQQTTPQLPNLVHVNRVRGVADHVNALSLLEAYRELSHRMPEYEFSYEKTLTALGQADPGNERVQEGLGQRALKAGDFPEAIAHLRRSIALSPGRALPYSLLSEALAHQGNLDEAISASEHATRLDPYEGLYQRTLVEHLIEAKQYDKAVAAMEHYMELFPEDDFMRKMLKMARE